MKWKCSGCCDTVITVNTYESWKCVICGEQMELQTPEEA